MLMMAIYTPTTDEAMDKGRMDCLIKGRMEKGRREWETELNR
jgi:hypothetical protein